MRTSLIAWALCLLVMVFLYAAGTLIWFNAASPPILGLPPLVFWFVLLPVISPLLIGFVYLVDRATGGIGAGVRGR